MSDTREELSARLADAERAERAARSALKRATDAERETRAKIPDVGRVVKAARATFQEAWDALFAAKKSLWRAKQAFGTSRKVTERALKDLKDAGDATRAAEKDLVEFDTQSADEERSR